jgi:predicted NBD/HSP70 family sugar kinase
MTLPRGRAQSEGEARSAPHLRRLNRERILAIAMDRPEPFTRAQLTAATGLSAPTVGDLAAELIRAGLLRDLGAGPSRGGRRPAVMEFDARYGFTVGIALGSTKTQLALADLRGERLAHRVMPTPRTGPTRALAQLAAWTRTLLRDAGVPRDKLMAAAVGVPGAVDRERGMVVALTPNLKGWSSVPVAELLGRSLGVPVVVENDVNLAVLGEHWRGAARGHDTCAFIHVGTGIGAGILVEGHLHRGHHYLAGEIGLTCLGPQYVETDFGARGCLETLAGMGGLLVRWNGGAKGRDGAAPLLEAAAAGDRAARRAIGEAATLIGIATANLSLALDPSLIALGGALTAQEECFVGEVRRVVGRIIPRPPEIVVSSLGREAPLWGGLLLATNEAHAVVRGRLRAPAASRASA